MSSSSLNLLCGKREGEEVSSFLLPFLGSRAGNTGAALLPSSELGEHLVLVYGSQLTLAVVGYIVSNEQSPRGGAMQKAGPLQRYTSLVQLNSPCTEIVWDQVHMKPEGWAQNLAHHIR